MDAIKILNVGDSATVVKTAAASPLSVATDRTTILVVENGGATQITVTLRAVKGNDVVYTVAAGAELAVNLMQDDLFNRGDSVQVEFSAVTSVNVFALQTK
jgi:hypothetical protein